MRQGVFKRVIIAAFAAALVWAPGALAATPDEIYKDLADNGQLDGTYTQAELQAFLQSASVQGYGNPLVVVPVITTVAAPPPESGVAGESKTIENKSKPVAQVAGVATPAQAPLTRTASVETLPFTGIELGLFALVGAALLLGGFLLRASARQR